MDDTKYGLTKQWCNEKAEYTYSLWEVWLEDDSNSHLASGDEEWAIRHSKHYSIELPEQEKTIDELIKDIRERFSL